MSFPSCAYPPHVSPYPIWWTRQTNRRKQQPFNAINIARKMSDNETGRPLQRTRSASGDLSSVAKSRAAGKLCDVARTVVPFGTGFVDDDSAISPTLAAAVNTKAFRLRITVYNTRLDQHETYVGQVGLLRGERMISPPPPVPRDRLSVTLHPYQYSACRTLAPLQ